MILKKLFQFKSVLIVSQSTIQQNEEQQNISIQPLLFVHFYIKCISSRKKLENRNKNKLILLAH